MVLEEWVPSEELDGAVVPIAEVAAGGCGG